MITLSAALAFVKGSIAKKDFVPVLTCLRFEPGRVTGFNGTMSLSAPVPTMFRALVPGGAMLNAANACEGRVTVAVDDAKVTLGSGKVYVHVALDPDAEDYPTFGPGSSDKETSIEGPLLPMLQKAEPFMSEDASKPWTCGASVGEGTITTTNNVILFRGQFGLSPEEDLVLPAEAVRELLRIGEEPCAVTYNARTVSFFYKNDRWLTTKRLDNNWPDSINSLLSGVGPCPALPKGFFDAVEKLRKFVAEAGYVYVREGYVATSAQPDKQGASVGVAGLDADACFHVEQLLKLSGAATGIDFSSYPKPCSFVGKGCGGLIVGMRSTEETTTDGPAF